MTIDQMLFVATKIHDWNKSPDEIVKRSIEICANVKIASEVQNAIDGLDNKNLPMNEMFKEVMKTIGLLEGVCSDANRAG